MKWFRLWTDILDDVKILQLSDYEFRVWVQIMAYACEVDSMSGQCQTNVKSMSLRCRTQVNHLSRAIETFQKMGMVTIDEQGFITITNWNKRQFKSDNAYERVKKFREVTAKRNVSKALHETAPDTDTDTDTDKPPIPPKKRGDEYEPDFLTFWSKYPKKAKKPNAYQEWKKLGSKRPGISVIIACIDKQKNWRTWIEGYIPDPERWLKNERWQDEEPPKGGNGNGQRQSYGQRGPGISLPLEWKGDDIPDISEADRERNTIRARELADKIGKG